MLRSDIANAVRKAPKKARVKLVDWGKPSKWALALERLPDILDEGETVSLVAISNKNSLSEGLLMLTDRRLLVRRAGGNLAASEPGWTSRRPG